jgi:hypothetical protein
MRTILISLLVFGCSSGSNAPAPPSKAPDAALAKPKPQPAIVVDAAPAEPKPQPQPLPKAEGVDFTPELRVIRRVAACAGDEPLPDRFDAAALEKYCTAIHESMATYKEKWIDVAVPFLRSELAKAVPGGIPPTVVYPFGGGDLLTALGTYPDATEITTLSLEGVGDPRAIDTLKKHEFHDALKVTQRSVGALLKAAWSATASLNLASNTDLPALLIFSLIALELHGYEPVSLRYFRVNDDGTLHYLDDSDVKAHDAHPEKKEPKSDDMVSHDDFDDMELTYRKAGDPSAPLRVYRHIAADLSNGAIKHTPGPLAHLAAKGKVAEMTKAAAYLLWNGAFTTVRDELIDHMVVMVSDETGVPPKVAEARGLKQITYGQYGRAGLLKPDASTDIDHDFHELWKSNPQQDLPFSYGYPDKEKHSHMMITIPAK